jgi:hypothetical protein
LKVQAGNRQYVDEIVERRTGTRPVAVVSDEQFSDITF